MKKIALTLLTALTVIKKELHRMYIYAIIGTS